LLRRKQRYHGAPSGLPMTADVLGWYGVHSSARGCGHHRQKSPLPACLMLRDGCRSQSTDTYARNHVRTLARSSSSVQTTTPPPPVMINQCVMRSVPTSAGHTYVSLYTHANPGRHTSYCGGPRAGRHGMACSGDQASRRCVVLRWIARQPPTRSYRPALSGFLPCTCGAAGSTCARALVIKTGTC
jgi:hypothetical protein